MSAHLDLIDSFESGRLDPTAFSHRAHVETAFALLARTDFIDAARRYQHGIELLALKAGAPQKANLTITLAFLSIIAERMENAERAGDFLAANPDLLDSRILTRWYDVARLASPLARRVFLMPDPIELSHPPRVRARSPSMGELSREARLRGCEHKR